jgi:hypothetical protein
MFWAAVYHRPFPLFGIHDVYLAPEDQSAIQPPLPEPVRQQFFVDPAELRDALNRRRALVLDVAGGRVRDVTSSVEAAR